MKKLSSLDSNEQKIMQVRSDAGLMNVVYEKDNQANNIP